MVGGESDVAAKRVGAFDFATSRRRSCSTPSRATMPTLAQPVAVRAVPAQGHNLVAPAIDFRRTRRRCAESASRVAPSRLLTIVGPGGMGKTRLAVESGCASPMSGPTESGSLTCPKATNGRLVAAAVAELPRRAWRRTRRSFFDPRPSRVRARRCSSSTAASTCRSPPLVWRPTSSTRSRASRSSRRVASRSRFPSRRSGASARFRPTPTRHGCSSTAPALTSPTSRPLPTRSGSSARSARISTECRSRSSSLPPDWRC